VVVMASTPPGRSQALPLQAQRRTVGMNYNCSTKVPQAGREEGTAFRRSFSVQPTSEIYVKRKSNFGEFPFYELG
jgi:hypothetical protein